MMHDICAECDNAQTRAVVVWRTKSGPLPLCAKHDEERRTAVADWVHGKGPAKCGFSAFRAGYDAAKERAQ